MEQVRIIKLVHGGQGLAELADGRKVFVWNALPGELVDIRIIKNKRSYAEAIAENVVEPSNERIEPIEANYLATSPWQMMTFEAENKYKQAIVDDLFRGYASTSKGTSVSVSTADSVGTPPNKSSTPLEYHYRNKMEYSFWGDDDGLHLALHQRGSHGKQIVEGSELAMSALDAGAQAVLAELQKLNPRAGDLKTLIVRCSQKGEVVAALYTKLTSFTKLSLPEGVQGLRVYHSNPKSPASVPTELLVEYGDATLTDSLLDVEFQYDVDSFFQVNLPVAEQAYQRIKDHLVAGDFVDMYSGVGSIGLSVARDGDKITLVELDPASAAQARINLAASGHDGEVVETSTEKALEYISSDKPVIFDPPRAGLHAKVAEKCLEAMPPQIIYLSCNPATQVRDLELLSDKYKVDHFEVFNFFPRTPHIETLAVLTLK